jgi:3-oxoacyl-[acyl-carrier-protein] synthase-3
MSGNSVFKHRHSGVLSITAIEAPVAVTSEWIDEQLADTYARTGARPGLLKGLAGIAERRWWDKDVTFADAAALAGRAAIQQAGIDPSKIGLLMSTSVCKDHLEPSIACDVHHQLGLSASCMNFDIANACLGFTNAMHVASTMLDAGTIEYALIVDGEGSRYTQETTIERLRRPETTADDVFAEFASLTLGSGAAAMVLGRTDRHPEAHRIVGGVARAATEHNRLCVGTLDRMTTDTKGLLVAGLDLAADTWANVPAEFGWGSGIDWYILHQVSQVHTAMLCDRLGIDPKRAPLTLQRYGNVGPAAMPITLASVQEQVKPGERVLCMGIGSGLNVSMTEIVW